MKVAVVTAYPRDPATPVGGVESVSVNLVAGLTRMPDLQVHVVTTDRTCRKADVSTDGAATIHRLPHRPRRVLTGAVGWGRRRIKRYLKALAPTVVHSHDVYGLMVKGLRMPRVFTIHGFIHADTAVSGTPFSQIRSRLWRRVETAGWRNQGHIISISPYVRSRLTGLDETVVHDIDNPVAESCFDIRPRERGATIFSAAVLSPRKNPLALIEAVRILIDRGLDVQLRLAGPLRDAGYVRRIVERIREPKLARHVKLLGTISAAAVRRELAAASVFALVSLEENSPMGVEEAMAAGLPVVTSDRCGMPHMVRDNESGYLVDPTDPADIAGRLEVLIRDEGRRRAMGNRSRMIALERFHPAVVAMRTVEVYRRAVRDYWGGAFRAAG